MAIFARVSAGESSAAATKAEGMSLSTYWRRIAASEETQKLYELALAARAEVHAEEIITIADEIPPLNDEGKMDAAFVAWQKNRINTRQWNASRLLPKRYGDKLELDAKVSVGDAIIERLARAKERA